MKNPSHPKNPFDDHHSTPSAGTASGASSTLSNLTLATTTGPGGSMNTSSSSTNRRLTSGPRSGAGGAGPRLSPHVRPVVGGAAGIPGLLSLSSSALAASSESPPLWTARHVEWPIPCALPLPQFQKLSKATKQMAQQMGLPLAPATTSNTSHNLPSPGLTSPAARHEGSVAGGGSAAASDLLAEEGHGSSESSYYGLTGFMSRVLNPSTPAADHKTEGTSGSASAAAGEEASSRPLRPPRPGCVAAANGWIVAVLECPTGPANKAPSSSSSSLPHHHYNNSSSPPLRLVSRWNVRRGGAADQWIALPPPVWPPPTAATPAAAEGRLVRIFVDPTASHTLLSAANGEAYYLHSSHLLQQRPPIKLAGFGPAPTEASYWSSASGASTTTAATAAAAYPKERLTGVSATAVAHRRDEASQAAIQAGLSLGSYVTAVAWDKERGTEGSTKKILLGTSAGEIYEYALVSPTHGATGAPGAAAGEPPEEAPLPLPILLHKLPADASDPTQVGAAVTGLYFERLRTGLLVLAATSGRFKRTRFYTFYSAHNSSFRMVMADQQHASLVELPGSVDFADLRLCNDHFALRTATGIYYGTIDRSLSGPAVLSGRSSMIVDAGILPYEVLGGGGGGKSGQQQVPVSVAITPHHIITLGENNEVRFINRVAQKVIQKERLDLGSLSANNAGGGGLDDSPWLVGELMMDIRRADQVWIRRGRSLVHVSSSQEDRDVWKFTLQKCLELSHKNRSAPSSPEKLAATMTSSSTESRGEVARYSVPPPLTDEEKAQEALFEQAKNLCSNPAQKAVVAAVRAEFHLLQGRGELAAKYLAQCPPILAPFSDTAVRLALPKLGIDDPLGYGGSVKARASLEASNISLITYLGDKMRTGALNGDKMTCTMVGAWLTELFLNERSEQVSAAMLDDVHLAAEVEASQRALLAMFLNSNVENMDAKTIMKILASHDVGAGECSSYAARSGDIATAVNAALSMGSKDTSGAYEALRILNDAPFELAEPLYYKHASILLARVPSAAGDSFLSRYLQGLSPLRLLPSIMHYEQARSERARRKKTVETSQAKGSDGDFDEAKSSIDISVDGPKGSSEGFEIKIDGIGMAASFVDDSSVAMKYLEGVIILGCRSSAIYSYLIHLYAKLDDEEPLYEFVSSHVPATSSLTDSAKRAMMAREPPRDQSADVTSPLDMSHALRTVLSSGRHYRSAIKLYMGFGMRQQAVELALKVDPALARELALESVELDERKRLWLMIAKSAASDVSTRGGKDVVSRVVSVLRDCGPDVLSIEDVLPFLPDFAQIDQIKDEICEALTSYSSKIEGYLREMSECDQACEMLRAEIGRLRNHHMRVKADARCALTKKIVASSGEPFYVFPSGFVYLASALKKEVTPYLNERQRGRVDELERLLGQMGISDPNRGELQMELDGLIAAECPLTGSIMVESIEKDFDDSSELDGSEMPNFIERAEV